MKAESASTQWGSVMAVSRMVRPAARMDAAAARRVFSSVEQVGHRLSKQR